MSDIESFSPVSEDTPAMGSDPHGRFAEQQEIYNNLVDEMRTPRQKYQSTQVSENDGGAVTGGDPTGIGATL